MSEKNHPSRPNPATATTAGTGRRLPDAAAVSMRVVNHISTMVAYWDSGQRCIFSNNAYREWFGKTPEEMVGMSMQDLLGPNLYAKNLPFILKVLAGEQQVFERQIKLPNGDVRDSIATYTPDVVDGRVLGFSAHVADVTRLRQREAVLEQTLREAIGVLKKTKGSFRSKELGQLRERLVQLSRS